MNDLSVIVGVGVFVAVISGLSYKLGQAKEGRANAGKKSEYAERECFSEKKSVERLADAGKTLVASE